MSATLASSEVFDAFKGDTKLRALLHGHSYSGHVAGASAGVAALKIFSNATLNPALEPRGYRLHQLWPAKLVHQISKLPLVDSVIALGPPLIILTPNMLIPDLKGHCSGSGKLYRIHARLGNIRCSFCKQDLHRTLKNGCQPL